MASRFLAMVDDPDVELRQLAAVIEQDPALMARLIGLANSAYFGLRVPVTSAEEAIFKVLGLATAKSLALSIILCARFDTTHVPSFSPEQYWRDSLATGLVAQRLSGQVNAAVSESEAYLCGLLHGIGQLALAQLYPRAMEKVLAYPGRQRRQSAELERRVLGFDYTQVGGWLARKWHLPEPVVAAIEHHRELEYDGNYAPVAQLVGVSLNLATDAEDLAAAGVARLGISPEQVAQVVAEVEHKREAILAMAGLLANK